MNYTTIKMACSHSYLYIPCKVTDINIYHLFIVISYGVGLPPYNIPSPGVLMKSIRVTFLQLDVFNVFKFPLYN